MKYEHRNHQSLTHHACNNIPIPMENAHHLISNIVLNSLHSPSFLKSMQNKVAKVCGGVGAIWLEAIS